MRPARRFDRARFGVPVARTLGNCLSRANLMRLERAFGQGRTHRMLLLADLLDANEALAAGFLVAMAEPDVLETRVAEILDKLVANAPLTLAATRKLMRASSEPEEKVIARVYGSRDFKEGVSPSREAGAGLVGRLARIALNRRVASARDSLQRQIGGARPEHADRRHHHAHRPSDKTKTPNAPERSSTKAMTNELKITESRLHE